MAFQHWQREKARECDVDAAILLGIASTVLSVISIFIASIAAYAAWRTARPVPKIGGRITMVYTVSDMAFYTGRSGGSGLILHVILSNASPSAVHLVNFRIAVQTAYGDVEFRLSRKASATLKFGLDGAPYTMRVSEEAMISWPPRAVQYGHPLMGFITFHTDVQVRREEIRELTLTAFDVFGNDYNFKLTHEEIERWYSEQKNQTPDIREIGAEPGVVFEMDEPHTE